MYLRRETLKTMREKATKNEPALLLLWSRAANIESIRPLYRPPLRRDDELKRHCCHITDIHGYAEPYHTRKPWAYQTCCHNGEMRMKRLRAHAQSFFMSLPLMPVCLFHIGYAICWSYNNVAMPSSSSREPSTERRQSIFFSTEFVLPSFIFLLFHTHLPSWNTNVQLGHMLPCHTWTQAATHTH